MKLKFVVTLKTLAAILALSPLFLVHQQAAHALIGSNQKDLKERLQAKKPVLALRNWGLENTYPSHINVRKAWEITQGSQDIVVAVIDTGIDPNHPDLKDNLWQKPGSKRTIKTKDGRQKTVFEYGWDFVENKANPTDTHGHGTHVAGIIGATAKANAGAAGVARKVSIMAIRYYSEGNSGAENLNNTIKAINYAVDNGADIINYSGGGAEFSAAEYKAIKRARDKGIIFVAAAGNEHRNTDVQANRYYPGAYDLDNIISVAATNIRNQLLPSSNWGIQTVDVTAPGENIYSTLPNGKYGYLTGTSQGTAFVTGLAALMKAKSKAMASAKVIDAIVKNVDQIKHLKQRVRSGGRINAYAALKAITAPSEGLQLAEGKAEITKPDPFLYHPDFKRIPARNGEPRAATR